MPQLSTIYIFLIFVWTWLVLYMIMQKTKNVFINKTPTNLLPQKPQKTTTTLPWT